MSIYATVNAADEKKPRKKCFKRKRLAMTVFKNDVPAYESTDITRVRKLLQLTQPEFADVLGVPFHTMRSWETGRTKANGAVQHLLYLIERDTSLINAFVTIQDNGKQTSLLNE